MWRKGDKACIRLRKKSFRNCSGKLRRPRELYLPVETCGQVNYAPWSEDAKVDLDTLKTVKSAKDAFFPQSENLYTCYRDGKKISITPQELKEQPFVVFGMKACDLRGVEVLDKVFLADPVDTFYAVQTGSRHRSWRWPVTSRRIPASVRCLGSTVRSRRRM